MLGILDREPVLFVAVVTALINVGIAFGLNLSQEEKTAILAALNAVMAFVARSQVTPVNDPRLPPD